MFRIPSLAWRRIPRKWLMWMIKTAHILKGMQNKKIAAGVYLDKMIGRNKPMESATLAGDNHMRVQRLLLIEGKADVHCVQMLHRWLGVVSGIMIERYKRGNKTLRIGIKELRRGRLALSAALRRLDKLGKAGFSFNERADFDSAFDLAIAYLPSVSLMELSRGFDMSKARNST